MCITDSIADNIADILRGPGQDGVMNAMFSGETLAEGETVAVLVYDCVTDAVAVMEQVLCWPA